MSESEEELSAGHSPELEPVVEKISTEYGFDVRGYKRTTLYRRLQKRMADAGCPTAEDYLVRLETDPREHGQLVNTLLINVTEFFRDPPAWEYLQRECLEPLLGAQPPEEPFRAWSAGCATGEEAYSLAISIAELTPGRNLPVKIYATDMDEGAIMAARAAVYGPAALENVSQERRERFFEALPGGQSRVRREVRRMVIFGHHNLLEHTPISRVHVLVCRNLLIYFDAETQQQILQRFHYSLREDGFLFLGRAETLMSRSSLFTPVEPRLRIFRKHPDRVPGRRPPLPGSRFPDRLPERKDGMDSSRPATEQAVPIEQIHGPVLLLDRDGALVAASPAARELFRISDRVIGSTLAQLEERTRPTVLRVAIEDARVTARATRVEEVRLPVGDGKIAILNFEVRPLTEARGELAGLLVWGQELTREYEAVEELVRVREELEAVSEELQTSREELETINEELQSTNEELETTNEELQSTNEELETTIEELQSTNEELETTNDELRARQEALNERDRFQGMVLSSLQMGVVVVWSNWTIASWNRTCEELWGVREAEAVGQNLLQLDSGMPFDQIRKPILAVMQGEEPARSLELKAMNRRGRPLHCRVRIIPLQEPANGTAGAMILIEAAAERA